MYIQARFEVLYEAVLKARLGACFQGLHSNRKLYVFNLKESSIQKVQNVYHSVFSLPQSRCFYVDKEYL